MGVAAWVRLARDMNVAHPDEEKAPPVLSDARARTLAGYWHDDRDPSSPLSLLARNGTITLSTFDELRSHLARLGFATQGEESSSAHAQLSALLRYALARGPRGPVASWRDLRDSARYRDDVSLAEGQGVP